MLHETLADSKPIENTSRLTKSSGFVFLPRTRLMRSLRSVLESGSRRDDCVCASTVPSWTV